MSAVKRGPNGQFQGSYGGRRPEPSKRPYGRVSPARVAVVAVVGCATVGVFAGSVGVAWVALAGVGAFFGTKAVHRYLRTPNGRKLVAKLTKRQPRDVVQEPKPRTEKADPAGITAAKERVPVPPRRKRADLEDPETWHTGSAPVTDAQRHRLTELGVEIPEGLTKAMASRIITRHTKETDA